MGASLFDACLLGVLIIAAVSPGIHLMWISDTTAKRIVTVVLFIVSLIGFIGLHTESKKNPRQVTNLYNYGEDVK